jgi:hypothetical protein
MLPTFVFRLTLTVNMKYSVKHKSAISLFNGDDFVLCEMRIDFYIFFISTRSFKGVNCVSQRPWLNRGIKLHLSGEKEEKHEFGSLGCRPKFKCEFHK